jgi:hypothetical protein
MATLKKKEKKSVKRTSPYLTKRILRRAAKAGLRNASERTMQVMGFTIVAHNGWIVKKLADGTIEKISRINSVKRTRKIALD